MFLELMVAQLRYQDPMNPTDSGEFLAQSAQFTALEKMQDVADQTAALLGAQMAFGAGGLVGKRRHLDSTTDGRHQPRARSTASPSAPPARCFDVDGTQVPLAQVQSIGTSPSRARRRAPPPLTTPAPPEALTKGTPMLRSLFAGISGLRVNQTMLDVTGNNIANANTIGFKASTTVFQDTLSQMLTARVRRRPPPAAARTRSRSASASRSPRPAPTSTRARRRPPAAPPT